MNRHWIICGDLCVCPICKTEFFNTCNNILGQWDNEGVDCQTWMPKWNYCPDCGTPLNVNETNTGEGNTANSDSHGSWNVSCHGKVCECSSCGSEFDNTCNDILGEWHFCPHCGKHMIQS